MIACDVAVESDFEVSMVGRFPHYWRILTRFQVPDEESLFVPCADAIVPAFIIMYTV
jgi:uncharacterized protein (DUF924 family)